MSLAQVVPVGKVVYVTSVCYICIYTAATGLISLTTAELRPVRSVIWYPTCGKKPFPEVHIKKTVISVCTVWRTLLSLTLRSYYGRPVCQWQAFWSGIMTSSLRAVRFLSGGPHACTQRLVRWCCELSVTIWERLPALQELPVQIWCVLRWDRVSSCLRL